MNIFSFFSGAGFLDLGFEATSKYKVVYVNEIHEPFYRIYQKSRSHMGIDKPRFGRSKDVVTLLDEENLTELRDYLRESKKESLTGFIAGPPCPDFSVAGKNKGRYGDNGKLSGIYIDLICALKPDFFLFENVKGLYRTARHREYFEQLKNKLENNGYYLTEQLINAIEFGVPQDRERIILIGVYEEIVKKLNLKTTDKNLTDFPWSKYKTYSLDKVRSVPWPDRTAYEEGSVTPCPKDVIRELTVQYYWDKNDVTNHPNNERYFKAKAGSYIFRTKDEGDVDKKCYKRLHRHRYSPTAAYGNNEVHIHPYQPRRISVAEALAIQSLPPEFIIPGKVTLSDAFKAIGNGVPYLVAKGIAQSLADYLSEYIA